MKNNQPKKLRINPVYLWLLSLVIAIAVLFVNEDKTVDSVDYVIEKSTQMFHYLEGWFDGQDFDEELQL